MSESRSCTCTVASTIGHQTACPKYNGPAVGWLQGRSLKQEDAGRCKCGARTYEEHVAKGYGHTYQGSGS